MYKRAFIEPDDCSPHLHLLYDNVVINMVNNWILLQ